jgi:hypothetical protein
MATRFPFFDTRFFTADGEIAAGYYLDQYVSGTTTNQDTFTDAAGLVPNAHPLQLDSEGRCTMYGTPGLTYTFVLRATSTGIALRTWDDVAPNPTAAGTSYLPLAGGTMVGPITLAANAAASLQPVPLQQMNSALTALSSSVTAAVATATAAAAAAEAAVDDIAPQSYILAHASGSACTLSVELVVGTYQLILDTRARAANPSATSINATVTQSLTLDTATASNSLLIFKNASDGQTTHATGIATATYVCTVAGTYTLSMGAVSLASQTSCGSIAFLQRTA